MTGIAPKDIGFGVCPHGDPTCPHGTSCRYERCTKCGRPWHVLGARSGSACCYAGSEPARPPAQPLSFAERQIVRRFERAADGLCELCEGVGEVQARLPHMARWRLISCPVCSPAVER